MDEKTLNYMGKRVDEARELKRRIVQLDKDIEWFNKSGRAANVCYYLDGCWREFSKETQAPEVREWLAVHLRDRRVTLQAELDAI